MDQPTIDIEQSNLDQTSRPAPAPLEPEVTQKLRQALAGLMVVEDITVLSNIPEPPVQFRGHLEADDANQEEVFEQIVQRFEALGYTPILSAHEGRHIIHAIPHVFNQKPKRPWINVVLFVATLASAFFIGATREADGLLPGTLQEWLRGVPFMLAMMGILTAHELSHYFVGRRYGSPLSLPYFIPMPIGPLGTMGAVIVQQGPMRSRKALFDIGAAGPIGGLLVAIPLLFIGLIFTRVGHPSEFIDIAGGEVFSQEGNSVLYLAAKYIIHGKILPDQATGEDVWLSPPSAGGAIVFAAWAGLLVTGLNLMPIGQLDGGHITYALWGRNAWKVARAFVVLCFAWGGGLLAWGNYAGVTWLIWGALASLMGPRHPPPLNDLTPLDPRRKLLAWLMILIFFLIIIPIPFSEVTF
ncbi:MAG: site-2 protease family protein [Anaerolineae bacterium]|nr:site-2 protease family protein [Anaerolineae bacterium]